MKHIKVPVAFWLNWGYATLAEPDGSELARVHLDHPDYKETAREMRDVLNAYDAMADLCAKSYALLDAIYTEGPEGHEAWIARLRREMDEQLGPLLKEGR